MTILSVRQSSRRLVEVTLPVYIDMSELVEDWDNFEADILDSQDFCLFATKYELLLLINYESLPEGLVDDIKKCHVDDTYEFDRENKIFKVHLGMCRTIAGFMGVGADHLIQNFSDEVPFVLMFEEDMCEELVRDEKLIAKIILALQTLKDDGFEGFEIHLYMRWLLSLMQHQAAMLQQSRRKMRVPRITV